MSSQSMLSHLDSLIEKVAESKTLKNFFLAFPDTFWVCDETKNLIFEFDLFVNFFIYILSNLPKDEIISFCTLRPTDHYFSYGPENNIIQRILNLGDVDIFSAYFERHTKFQEYFQTNMQSNLQEVCRKGNLELAKFLINQKIYFSVSGIQLACSNGQKSYDPLIFRYNSLSYSGNEKIMYPCPNYSELASYIETLQ